MSKKLKVNILEQGKWPFSGTFAENFNLTEQIHQVFSINFHYVLSILPVLITTNL